MSAAAVATPPGPFSTGAWPMLRAGWAPLPITPGRKKSPPSGTTGEDGRDLSRADLQSYTETHAHYGVATRAPVGVIGIDIDQYEAKRGWQNLEALRIKHRLDPLPPTVRSSARAWPSGIRWYRLPEHVDIISADGEVIDRIPAAEVHLDNAPVPGVETIQRHHRYAMAWPTPHRDLGGVLIYRWYRNDLHLVDEVPCVGELPELSEAWCRALGARRPTVAVAADNPPALDHREADWSSRVTDTLSRRLAHLAAAAEGGRYDSGRDGALALLRLESLGDPGATSALDQLRDAYTAAVNGSRDHEGDAIAEWQRHTASGREVVRTTEARMPTYEQFCNPIPWKDAADKDPPPAPVPAPCLPADFWTARPELEHVRQAARAKLVAPDALLGVVLARVAVSTPHTVRLPGIIGIPIGLTFLPALVGASSSGKSSAIGVGGTLIKTPPTVRDGLPIGSGEGMIECLYDMVPGPPDENGKATKLVREQRWFGAIFEVDEGQVLYDLGSRSGSTLIPTFRSAYTNATLGNTNAAAERRRLLGGDFYVYAAIIGIQPELAGPLLADSAAGTPQRITWFTACDPGVTDDVDWPEPMPWTPPSAVDLERIKVNGPVIRHELVVAASIQKEVKADRLRAVSGAEVRPILDAHAMLGRLKVAALLALLDRRLDLNEQDWQLAGMVSDTSRRVRQSVEAILDTIGQRKEQANTERLARREHALGGSKEANALASAARSIARVVAKHLGEKEHEKQGGGCTQNCMTKAMSGNHRKLASVADIIGEAEHRDWIMQKDGRWHPGGSRPA